MLNLLRARLNQGHRTLDFPRSASPLPERYRGMPHVDPAKCADGCRACADACPVDAISVGAQGQRPDPRIDLGSCVFCADCVQACPTSALRYTQEFRMAARTRQDLVVGAEGMKLAQALDAKSRALFGRSLKLRQVSAGGCNGCEVEVNVLGTIVFDIVRFGIQMVASPRHADGLLITGPVTRNMRLALQKTYDAVPGPKLVIAVGGCAISGGPFRDHPQVTNGADATLPVDLYVPGCPPHPLTILDGLLRLLGRIEEGKR
ncbi:MAG: NADH-quinone oxidoreductase subunit NuoB [Dehalococcoidia bacterium]|nr:NADH-quinone oxidoreductase subunit NuoB [Dehalococcoidia bacterium]